MTYIEVAIENCENRIKKYEKIYSSNDFLSKPPIKFNQITLEKVKIEALKEKAKRDKMQCLNCAMYTNNIDDTSLRDGFCTRLANYNFNATKQTDFCSFFKQKESENKLQEYENAEKQGLLIRLPCKVGDTVYTIYDNGEDKPEIEARNIFDVSTVTIWLDSYSYHFPYDCFGKTVFLTREAAEEALAERQT